MVTSHFIRSVSDIPSVVSSVSISSTINDWGVLPKGVRLYGRGPVTLVCNWGAKNRTTFNAPFTIHLGGNLPQGRSNLQYEGKVKGLIDAIRIKIVWRQMRTSLHCTTKYATILYKLVRTESRQYIRSMEVIV